MENIKTLKDQDLTEADSSPQSHSPGWRSVLEQRARCAQPLQRAPCKQHGFTLVPRLLICAGEEETILAVLHAFY